MYTRLDVARHPSINNEQGGKLPRVKSVTYYVEKAAVDLLSQLMDWSY